MKIKSIKRSQWNLAIKSFVASTAALMMAGCGGGGDVPATATAAQLAAAPAPVPVSDPAPVPAPAPAPAPITIAAQAQSLAAKVDNLFKTAVPATSVQAQSLNDGCFLGNGFTKAMNTTAIDADIALYTGSNAFRVSSTRTNVRVIAERNITNADGSARKEIDTLYDISYTDGSTDKDAENTMVTGSTAGLCATPQNSAEWRFLGNQRILSVNVRARNERGEQYSRVNGAPLTNAATYFNGLQFNVSDPQGKATYAVVTGPGTATVSGVATPFSIKLLSTRLLKDDPLLAGKNNNFTNYTPEDTFRICRTPSTLVGNPNNLLPASATDCSLGASGSSRGRTLNVTTTGADATQIANADIAFASDGFVVGGTYTFKIYNDDGWKTVNGEANKTPIATYTAVNESLPYTFAQMVGTNGLTDHKFQKLAFGSQSPAQLAAALSSGVPSSLALTWNLPAMQADGRVFRFTELGEFFQGSKTSNIAPAFWPSERYYKPSYVPSTATAANGVAISPAPATILNKSYADFSLTYSDRKNSRIYSYVSFQ